ncbi:WD40-repeat-containing domain protein [Paraphysoderma sedebokerense]|nr:WD40-repeat-containing domain protein [Paraphysoderma sedebokerense]
MRIIKPLWLTHSNEKKVAGAIYSIDFHPDGKRVATAGIDTRIKLWNIAPLLDSDAERDPNIPKCLAELFGHQGSVLCVRWSKGNGKYLASSSDGDNMIMIWQQDRSSMGGNLTGSNIESWRSIRRLPGHTSDVVDLSWSHDNVLLASCALDSTVRIWSGTTFESIKVISAHTNFVKGLAFDPVGKYLATASDDKTVRIFNTTDWELVDTIENPYTSSTGSTWFRRCSWSADASYLATSNAFNMSVPVGAVIKRDAWNEPVINLVGHTQPTEVAKFNPILFRRAESPEKVFSVVAMGSQDKKISIYKTLNARASVVGEALFSGSVSDLSWSPDGLNLLASSLDGTVVGFIFNSDEFGTPVPEEEKLSLLSKYGFKRMKVIVPETPTQLEMEELLRRQRDDSLRPSDESKTDSTGQVSNQLAIPTSSSTPFSASTTSPMSKSTSVSSNFVASNQIVTQKKDGKKRIQPIMVANIGEAPTITTSFSSATPSRVSSVGIPPSTPQPSQPMNTSSEQSELVRTDGITATFKRKEPPISDSILSNSTKRRSLDNNIDSSAPQYVRPNAVHSANSAGSVVLTVPAVKDGFSCQIKTGTSNFVLDCKNNLPSYPRISLLKDMKVQWQDYLPTPVTLMAGSDLFFIIITNDGTMYVYSPGGRRLLPPIVVDNQISFVDVQKNWLMIVTCAGNTSVWDIPQQKCLLDSVSLLPIFSSSTLALSKSKNAKPPTLSAAAVRPENGIPVFTLSNRQSFTYHLAMKVWVRITDPSLPDPDFMSSLTIAPAAGILAKIQAYNSGSSGIQTLQSYAKLDPRVQATLSVSALETFLASAKCLQSPREVRYWLKMYVDRLANEEATEKLNEICTELLGSNGYV